jgi:hypothetical protein
LGVGVDVWVLLNQKAPPLMSSARRKLVHGARIRYKRYVKTEESINACSLLLKQGLRLDLPIDTITTMIAMALLKLPSEHAQVQT